MKLKAEDWWGIIAIIVFVLCCVGMGMLYLHVVPVLIN